jgi:hypothetical protein
MPCNRTFFFVLFILLSFSVHLAGQSLGADRFPLMAWDYVDDPKVLESMHDCGINSVAFVHPSMLDACQRFDIKGIVFDERLAGKVWSKPFDGDRFRANFATLLKEVGDHPAIYGYHIKDEPSAKDYPELAKAVAAVKQLAPGKWPYINLFPGQGDSYRKYVEDFVSICSPTALSYDRYSIIGETGSGDLDPAFWGNLAQMRDIAKEHQLPFWNIVLSSPHWRYRDLTAADIRIQVWGSLVYGVRGLAFYKFISREVPILEAADLGNFRGGPLDQFYEKTITWNWLRNMNHQVQNLAPVLLQLESVDTYHIGAVPRFNHGPSEHSWVRDIPGGDFVVGEFKGKTDTRYVMIVNKSLKNSAHPEPLFQPDIKGARIVSSIDGKLKPFTRFYWLAPGQGVLLQLD